MIYDIVYGGRGRGHRADTVRHNGALSTVYAEGIDNQSDREPLGHCLLYIQGVIGYGRSDRRVKSGSPSF